jgi:hypothetical protein
VDALGFNAIDFASFDFWPTDERFRPGADVREALPYYSDHAAYDHLQIRCWKKTDRIDLAASGGHDAHFPDRSVFPIRFILRHYPIRCQAQGERQVFHERQNRFLDTERARGWHVQYDDVREGASFVRDPAGLTKFDGDAIRIALALRHRGVEDLESMLDALRRQVDANTRELSATVRELERQREAAAHAAREVAVKESEAAQLRADVNARTTALAMAEDQLRQRNIELDTHKAKIARLAAALDAEAKDLDDVHRSLSWRWTAPARAMYRMLGLGRRGPVY